MLIYLDLQFLQKPGIFNVKVKSSTAIITDKNQFELIFNIDSGNKYFIDKFIFNDNDNISIKNIEKFQNQSSKFIGKKYSKKEIILWKHKCLLLKNDLFL